MKAKMKPIRTVGILLLLAVMAAVVLGWYEVRRDFSARATPSSIEVFAATTARSLAVPSSYRRLQNPLAATPENIQAGMEHFANHCATCHGNDGSGDTMFGKGLYSKPPDLRAARTQTKSDGALYYTIENGIRLSGMPAFGEEHVIGTVTKVTHNSITVQTTAKAAVEVQIMSETTFKKDNPSASLKEIQIGDRVVIHAMAMPGGKLMAHTVQIGISKKPPSSH